MTRGTRPTPQKGASAPAPSEPAAARTSTPHALYALADVEAALGRDRGSRFVGDSDEDTGPSTNRTALLQLLDAGETGRWRTLAHPDAASIVNGGLNPGQRGGVKPGQWIGHADMARAPIGALAMSA